MIALTHLDTAADHPELRICRGYDIDGEKVTRLPVGPAGDLNAQKALTRRLLRARRLYDGGGGDWVPVVEEGGSPRRPRRLGLLWPPRPGQAHPGSLRKRS